MSEAKELTEAERLIEKYRAKRRQVAEEKRAEGPDPTSPTDAGAALARPTRLSLAGRQCTDCGAELDAAGVLCATCRADRDRRVRDEEAERVRLERATRILDLLDAAGVSVREHGAATFDSYDASESGPEPVDAARTFVDAVRRAGKHDPVPGLYLWGQTGTGKSHLAVAAVRELLLDPRIDPAGVRWDHALELIAQIQATYGTGESTIDVLRSRYRPLVWVLDDFGTERASDDVARHLTLIFTKRAQWPTIVTSNYGPDELESQRPELKRVVSRLGYFRVCEVRGRDRRFD